ncbi:MAG: hypothetical protein C4308_02600 [Chitinophagaceae bacterium]
MRLPGIPAILGTNLLQGLGWAVLNSLWQMAFLWVIYQVILSFGSKKPSVKSKLAAIFLHIGFAWFLFTFFYHWVIDPNSPKSSLFAVSTFNGDAAAAWTDQLQTILPYASIGYLVMLVLPVIQFIRNYRYVQIIRNNGLSKSHVDIRLFVRRYAERLGINKPVSVYLSTLISSPVTMGYLKPVILLPFTAVTQLSASQVEAVLLHELAHIRRYDYLLNLLVKLISTVLYYNPFVKLFVKTIEREREKSCDEMVIQFQYDPHGYASALLQLEKNNFAFHRMAIAASGKRYDLLHRIEKILGADKKTTSPDFRKLGGLLAGLVCIVGLNALFIFTKPIVTHQSFSFAQFTSPFYSLLTDGEPQQTALLTKAERAQIITNKPSVTVLNEEKLIAEKQKQIAENFKEINIGDDEHYMYTPPVPEAGFAQVDNREFLAPVLKKSELKEIQEAVEATRKVLSETKWKEIEKDAADALTQSEKALLKEKYYAELEELNWQNLEEKLKLFYKQLNWDNITARLTTEMTNIRLDSLTTVYNLALQNLSQAESWMQENNCTSIPDTDLQLQQVRKQQEQLRQQLRQIKAIRNKKIIHL